MIVEMELINLISQVGFPIVISVYVLTRLEKSLKENTKVMQEMMMFLKTKID